jgi:hypothetical protein
MMGADDGFSEIPPVANQDFFLGLVFLSIGEPPPLSSNQGEFLFVGFGYFYGSFVGVSLSQFGCFSVPLSQFDMTLNRVLFWEGNIVFIVEGNCTHWVFWRWRALSSKFFFKFWGF